MRQRRASYLSILASLFLAAMLTLSFSNSFAYQTEDLSSDPALEEKRRSTELRERMTALYAQGRYNEAIDVANEILNLDPENGIAYLYKNMAETRIMEGRTAPPVVTNLPTPAPRPTPEPYVPPPVQPTVRKSSFSMSDIKDNPVLMGIVIVLGVLVLVAIVLGIYVMRRPKEEPVYATAAKKPGGKKGSMTDMPTQKGSSMLSDMPTRGGLADMPTGGSLADMPTGGRPIDRPTKRGLADMPTASEPVYANRPAPAAADPHPSVHHTNEPLVSDDEIPRPVMKHSPPVAPVAVVAASSTPPAPEPDDELKSSISLDLSDSQVDDIQATGHGPMDAPAAPPFTPTGSKSTGSRSMPLPPIAGAAAAGAAAGFAAAPPPDTATGAPPLSEGDTVLPAKPGSVPLFVGGDDDPFAAPPPSLASAPPAKRPAPGKPPTSIPAPASSTGVQKDEPTGLSYNSLMFGGDAPPSLAGAPKPPAKQPAKPPASVPEPVEDPDNLTKTSFNRQFNEVMMGPGAEKTGIHIDMSAPSGEGDAPPAGSEPTHIPAKVSAKPALELDATQQIEPVTAAPNPAQVGGASSSSMFQRQLEAGKAAFNGGDFAKAVQCLSVAATLRPTDMEVRALLDEARKKRRA